jgi:hypothetical protein
VAGKLPREGGNHSVLQDNCGCCQGNAGSVDRGARCPPATGDLRCERRGERRSCATPLLSDLCREHQVEPVPQKSNGLMADVDPRARPRDPRRCAATVGTHVHHGDQTDHFWRAVEISEWAGPGPELPRSEAGPKNALTPPRSRRGHGGPALERARSPEG